MAFHLYFCRQPNMISGGNMYTQEEVWIYAAIYFVLLLCSFVCITFIVMTIVMGYFMVKDYFCNRLILIEDKI